MPLIDHNTAGVARTADRAAFAFMKSQYAIQPSVEVCAKQCRAGCCRAPGHVVITKDEMLGLKSLNWRVRFEKHEKPGMWVMNFRKGRDCRFLDQATSLCSIYAHRPEGCRTFPKRPAPGCRVWPIEEVSYAVG